MVSFGSFDAKTHFSKLLSRVEKGERITITKHGRPVAELVPVQKRDPAQVQATIAAIKELRKGQTLGGLKIRDMINEGRR
ncbi:MAG: type II toxin-antitoxin system Phd/YefM family antitoxin [Phycisphaerales bacterium]